LSRQGFKILENPPIEESYDYAEQVRRQIERCLEASAIQEKEIREGTYKACILSLANLVPLDDRDKEYNEALDACTVKTEKWVYRKRGTRKIGTTENPINDSPKLEAYDKTDWNEYFMVVFNKYVELKVTVRRGSYTA